jgi:hypothetical protein
MYFFKARQEKSMCCSSVATENYQARNNGIQPMTDLIGFKQDSSLWEKQETP